VAFFLTEEDGTQRIVSSLNPVYSLEVTSQTNEFLTLNESDLVVPPWKKSR
jgi:hypothetical protein